MSIVVAIISAVGLILAAIVSLRGYQEQKENERASEIRKKQQEIYTRIVSNLVNKLTYIEKCTGDPKSPSQIKNWDDLKPLLEKYPEIETNFQEWRELMALLNLYGSDDAVKACADFHREVEKSLGSGKNTTLNPLMLKLRKSIFPATTITTEDISYIVRDNS